MKKILWIVGACSLFSFCTPKPQDSTTCFKGRLAKRGVCGQRVVELLDTNVNGLMIARNWHDSLSGRNYRNVFTVANPCDFPAILQQGDEFSFRITVTPGTNCIQCYAYTPVPSERNNILIGCMNPQ